MHTADRISILPKQCIQAMNKISLRPGAIRWLRIGQVVVVAAALSRFRWALQRHRRPGEVITWKQTIRVHSESIRKRSRGGDGFPVVTRNERPNVGTQMRRYELIYT